MAGFILKGTVYGRRINPDGSYGKRLCLGNTNKLAVTATSDIQNRTSKMKETYGQIIGTVSKPKPCEVEYTTDEMNRENMRNVLLGTDSDFTVEAAADQSATFDLSVAANRESWLMLGKFPIDPDSVTVEVGATPVAAAHYELRPDSGMILFKSSAPATGTATVSFDVVAATGHMIAGSTEGFIAYELFFEGVNLDGGARCHMLIDKVTCTPSQAFDLLGDSWGNISYKGNAVTLPGKTSPFTYWNLDEAA